MSTQIKFRGEGRTFVCTVGFLRSEKSDLHQHAKLKKDRSVIVSIDVRNSIREKLQQLHIELATDHRERRHACRGQPRFSQDAAPAGRKVEVGRVPRPRSYALLSLFVGEISWGKVLFGLSSRVATEKPGVRSKVRYSKRTEHAALGKFPSTLPVPTEITGSMVRGVMAVNGNFYQFSASPGFHRRQVP